MSKPPPPAPTHLLRCHSSPITALSISTDNERIYSGDASGKVVVTSTRTLRSIASWNAHSDSILGVEELHTHVITHGRDNKLHVWHRVEDLPRDAGIRGGGSASTGSGTASGAGPTLAFSMDVNALNYCRFSMLPLPTGSSRSGIGPPKALVALPNLIDSSTADIWNLGPTPDWLHAAIGQSGSLPNLSGRGTMGIIMSLHLYNRAESQHPEPLAQLHLLAAYESGNVVLRRYVRADKPRSIEGQGWETIWSIKAHVETIMAMAVSRSNTFALTVSADHLVVRYDLSDSPSHTVFKTRHAGYSCIAIHDDEKVCAVGGWDGCLRLFSTKSCKSLGTLKYHTSTCQAVTFAHPLLPQGRSQSQAQSSNEERAFHESNLGEHSQGTIGSDNGDSGSFSEDAIEEEKGKYSRVEDEGDEDEDEDFDDVSRRSRARWLLGGGKDNRLSIWTLMDFGSSSSSKIQT